MRNIRVRGTARAQQGHKEEQGNNIPVGTPENSGIADPKKIAFDSGVKLLGASGINERQARGVVGKWVKENGPSKVIDALGKAQREGAIDPLSFCQGIFKFEKSKTTTDATNGGAFGKIPERC